LQKNKYSNSYDRFLYLSSKFHLKKRLDVDFFKTDKKMGKLGFKNAHINKIKQFVETEEK